MWEGITMDNHFHQLPIWHQMCCQYKQTFPIHLIKAQQNSNQIKRKEWEQGLKYLNKMPITNIQCINRTSREALLESNITVAINLKDTHLYSTRMSLQILMLIITNLMYSNKPRGNMLKISQCRTMLQRDSIMNISLVRMRALCITLISISYTRKFKCRTKTIKTRIQTTTQEMQTHPAGI